MWIEQEIFGRLFSLANQLQTVGDSFLTPITTKQWFLLACIQRFEPHEPSLGELVPVVGSSRQNIKQLALKLEKMHFLTIRMDSQDHRILRLSLTAECRAHWQQRSRRDTTFLEQLFRSLDPNDLQTTLATLKTIETNIQKE